MLNHQPFGPVNQWGFLARDLNSVMQFWIDRFGVGPWWGFRGVSIELEMAGQKHPVSMDVGMAYQNGVQIEIVQPSEGPSPYADFLASGKAQMLHQIGYFTPDLAVAKTAALAQGYELYAEFNTGSAYFSDAMLGDMVVEFTQCDDNMLAYYKTCADESEAWDGKTEPFRLMDLS